MKTEESIVISAFEKYRGFSSNLFDGGDWGEYDAFEEGVMWQEKRSYSKEEVLEHLNLLYSMKNSTVDTFTDEEDYITMSWFEQFKNKKL